MKIIYFFFFWYLGGYSDSGASGISRPVKLLNRWFHWNGYKLFYGHMEVGIGDRDIKNSFKIGISMPGDSDLEQYRDLMGLGPPLQVIYSTYDTRRTSYDYMSDAVCFTSKSDQEIVDLVTEKVYPYFHGMRNNCNIISFQIVKLLCPDVNLKKKFPFLLLLLAYKSLGVRFPRRTKGVYVETYISDKLKTLGFNYEPKNN
jgi:hypothetical protein